MPKPKSPKPFVHQWRWTEADQKAWELKVDAMAEKYRDTYKPTAPQDDESLDGYCGADPDSARRIFEKRRDG